MKCIIIIFTTKYWHFILQFNMIFWWTCLIVIIYKYIKNIYILIIIFKYSFFIL